MAVNLFMQLSHTNGTHLCTEGQYKNKKFFMLISSLLPSVSVTPDLLCCFIFTLSGVNKASRKLFPLHLSNTFSQISALLVGADANSLDASKSKDFIIEYQIFQSHLQWQLKRCLTNNRKMGKRAHCQFGYWLFISPVLPAKARWISELLANSNDVEQGKCTSICYAGSLGRQNIFIVNRIFTSSYTNMAFVLIKLVLEEPNTNFWAFARIDIHVKVNSVGVWIASWLLLWRGFYIFSGGVKPQKLRTEVLYLHFAAVKKKHRGIQHHGVTHSAPFPPSCRRKWN